MAHTILRLPVVKQRTGLSRSSIYLAMSRDEFPRAIHLGKHAVGWLESDIEAWLAERIERSRPAAGQVTRSRNITTQDKCIGRSNIRVLGTIACLLQLSSSSV